MRELDVKIAEILGWEYSESIYSHGGTVSGWLSPSEQWIPDEKLPEWSESLDLIHAVEMTIPPERYKDYVEELSLWACSNPPFGFDDNDFIEEFHSAQMFLFATATARERANAIISMAEKNEQ